MVKLWRENKDAYIKKYKEHNDNICKYFYNKKNFIKINLGNEEEWQKACRFLGIKYIKLLHLNKNKTI